MINLPASDSAPLLSVTVIAKNEADRISRLIRSVAFADEVVVIDSGSADDTVKICEQAGAIVRYHEWMGYARQKQLALETARGSWVLCLDADELVSPEAQQEILSAISNAPEHVAAYSLPRLSRYLNRWIKHGGWYPDRKVRLVRRGHGKWIGDGIHEKLEVSGAVEELKAPLLHYVYRDIADQIATINRFSSVAAEAAGRPASGRHVIAGVFHAIGKFLECAVWKMGVLDGIPGLIIAMNSAFYVFVRHAKLWERAISRDACDE
ncbi:MAG: glycosyltransferase family 2 protein [Deltaproteobacteria bacterium]|nr:glycosyltransferase family 2 protein [Deltaproteobacteria bacterium]